MNILTSILGSLPYVLAGVLSVEQSIASQPGETKKQLILAGIDAAAKAGEQVPIPVVAGISILIDNLVTVLNNSGVFTHKTVAAAK